MNLTGFPGSDNNNSINGPTNVTQPSRDRTFSGSYGHMRYRENSVSSDGGISLNNSTTPATPTENDIAKFCKESNYCYSFANSATPTTAAPTGLQRLSSWTRRSSGERSLDCVRLLRSKLDGVDSGRRFSQPDMGAIDKQRSRYENMTRQHQNRMKQQQKKQHLTRLSVNHTVGNSRTTDMKDNTSDSDGDSLHVSSYSSLPTSPVCWEFGTEHESTLSKKNELGTIMENGMYQQHPIRSETRTFESSSPPQQQYTDYDPVSPWTDKPISDNCSITRQNSTFSCASRFLRALHTPTRFLPQEQAILTTDADGKILLFNDISRLCLGIDKSFIGRSILTKFDMHSQHTIARRLYERKKQLRHQSSSSGNSSGMVLMCGVIIPIIKSKDQKSAASLWLKEKWNQDQGQFIYLWIFEEIYESRLIVTIDNKGIMQDLSSKTLHDIYGYHKYEVTGQPINKLVPALNNESNPTTTDLVDKNEFYASRSKNGNFFPSMVQQQGSELQITLLPTISGLITIHQQSGMIQSINPVPAKYLFGYKVKDVAEVMHIDKLLPQFTCLVALLNQRQLLRHDRMVTCDDCLDAWRTAHSTATTTTHSSPTHFTAVHRDGGLFNVDVQIRLVDGTLYSVWITYNRISTSTTPIDTMLLPRNPSSTKSSTTKANVTTTTTLCETNDSTCGTLQVHSQTNNDIKVCQQQSPTTRPTLTGRFESFGAVSRDKALFPDMHNDSTSTSVSSTSSTLGPASIIFPEFDDFVVIDSLGEGAYGSAKLVHCKSDPSQEFVVKAIVKSRIVIDSWVRDRKHGSLPIEIHILLKLQQNPHVNCPQLVTFMEDEDNYYTVTRLHGDGMDLFDYIELNDQMTEGQVRQIFRQVAAAIQHLHHLRIVHRDIKDENILLDDRGIVQLIDFGSAAYYREGRLFDTFSGTLDYCSPEILNGTSYPGPPQDMWSLGILLYTLIYRETPFYSVDDIMERNLQLPYVPYPEMAIGPVNLLYKLLNRDVNKRPTIDQVMQDPWLQLDN
ncbi:hypothetical protein BC941DRAFT_471150 [Chlamydoabsidia padenii]|nr:hypothetical protein BC941DRAFT_471150 [Chlamydoabsidia padenii]